MVGLRIHEDSRIVSFDVICSTPQAEGVRVAWTSKPRVVAPPRKVVKAREPVTYVNDNGVVVDDPYYRTIFRSGSSERIVIEPDFMTPVPEDMMYFEPAVARSVDPIIAEDINYNPTMDLTTFEQGLMPANGYEMDYAREVWGEQPFVWRYDGGVYRGAVSFKTVKGSQDLVCPQNAFVTGLWTGWRGARGQGHLAEVQLKCGDGTERNVTMISQRFGKSKAKKAKKAQALRVERTECRGSLNNPHDGQFIQGIFGTVEDERVQTVGISCDDVRPPKNLSAQVFD